MNDVKRKLRSELRMAYREQTDIERRKIDEALIERFISTDIYRNSERIFAFASSGKEIYTHDFLELAHESGKIVALPKCFDKGIMHFYRFDGHLINGKFNIPEPTTDELLVPTEHDLMIVPGLAFDVHGYRVGQGGGYYDRYLAEHRCMTVGVCRSCFMIDRAPREWNDLPVDYVITEKELYVCKNGASEEAPLY